MSHHAYCLGIDLVAYGDAPVHVLGTDVPPDGGLAVVVRLKDIAATVQAEGGATGAAALAVAPNTVARAAYAKIADQLAAGFAEKNVPVDVRVVASSQRPTGDAPKGELLSGVGIGVGVTLGGYGAFRLIKHFLGRR